MSLPKQQSYKYCVVPRCKSTTISTPEKVFIIVPKDVNLRKQWFKVMRRDEMSPKARVYCCEDHFDLKMDLENYVQYSLIGGKVLLKKTVLPHIFKCQGRDKTPPKRLAALKRKHIETLDSAISSTVSQTSVVVVEPMPLVECDVPEAELDSTNLDPLQTCHLVVEEPKSKHSLNTKSTQANLKVHCRSKATYVNITATTNDTATSPQKVQKVNRGTSPMLNAPQDDSDDEVDVDLDESFKSDCLSSANDECSSENVLYVEEEDSNYLKMYMLKGTLMSIKRDSKLLLGLPKNCYFLINILSENIPCPHKNILISLKKIRLNESYSILAMQFGISVSNVGKIFTSTVPLLAKYMEKFIVWPDKKKIKSTLPMAFRARYYNVSVILDCLEIQIEKPTNAAHQSLTWSEYKGCNTIKYLICCIPNGTVSFISDGYGGRATDSVIFQDCGFIDKLSPGMHIMADRGFKHVSDLLLTKGCTLVRPPSVSSNMKSSSEDVMLAKRIAALRIHVERVIGRLRHFNMLKPHACITLKHVKILDEIIIIACGLINLQGKLMKI